MNPALVFLAKSPHEQTVKFAEEIAADGYFDVFVISDEIIDKKDYVDKVSNKVCALYIDDISCIEDGYKGCNITGNETHIKKEVIAWDKFLYIFCNFKKQYENVWVVEDDCFIPHLKTMENLNEGYKEYDLVTANNNEKTDDLLDWHWGSIVDKIDAPYYFSMVSAMGLSRNLLNKIKEFVDEHKTLFHIEALFNTIAMQNDLKVISPLELKTIVWQGEWIIDDFLILPNNIFHPIKAIEQHPRMREQIEIFRDNGYEPINTLPEFINEIM